MVLSYCLKCKAQNELLDGVQTTTKAGRPMLKGKCSVCNGGVVKMLPGSKVVVPSEQTGGNLAVVGAVAGTAVKVADAIGITAGIKQVVGKLFSELTYMIENPAAGKFKNIYVNKLPTLAKKYRDVQTDIDFINGKPGKMTKIKEGNINKLVRDQNEIESLILYFLDQLPIYKELAEAKDTKIQEREQAKAEAKIAALESELASLRGGSIKTVEKKKS